MKTFVLDTNVLLHNPNALESFADNEVVLPIEVIEEMDKFKRDKDEKGRNARVAIRTLDRLRQKGNLGKGVPLNNGGKLKIITNLDVCSLKDLDINVRNMDNKILLTAYHLQKEGKMTIFVSKDINARVKGDAIGLKTVDFEKQKVDLDRLYTGWREFKVSKDFIDSFYETKETSPVSQDILANEYVLLVDESNEKHTAISRFDKESKTLKSLAFLKQHMRNIKPRNKEQVIAQDLLLNDRINIVTLVGQAGTGKTLLALAAGLKKVVDDGSYKKLLISRPIMPLGQDIGYLPGSKEEKLENWMGPIFDNLEYILADEAVGSKKSKKRTKVLESYIDDGAIQLEALTYMRGRSIPNQFIIIDEAQNLTPHEMKTVISRAGNNTKMILTGDPNQIDNPYLDSASNGLTYVVEKLKGNALFGHITLDKSERSTLASLAAELL